MTAREQEIFKVQGFGQSIGMGEAPALLIIDFVNAFNDPKQFGGGNIDAAIKATVKLLATTRELGVPIAYTRYVFAEDGSDDNLLTTKVPGLKRLTEDSPDGQVVPELRPQPSELIIRKHNASGFFGTDLNAWLARRRVDTVLIAGAVTSGCVRATAIDAMGHGFRPIIVRDCIGDRAIGPHEASLFDLEQKYADVMTRDDVIAKLRASAAGRAAAE